MQGKINGFGQYLQEYRHSRLLTFLYLELSLKAQDTEDDFIQDDGKIESKLTLDRGERVEIKYLF